MTAYLGIEFREANPPVSDVELEAFEGAIGTQLPKDYRDFLKAVNGGVIVPAVEFPVENLHDGSTQLSVLFSVASDDHYYSLRHLDDYFFRRRVPNQMLPVGINVGEERICVSLRRDNFGKVYMWSPFERWIDELECEQTDKELYLAADSFAEMWASLKEMG